MNVNPFSIVKGSLINNWTIFKILSPIFRLVTENSAWEWQSWEPFGQAVFSLQLLFFSWACPVIAASFGLLATSHNLKDWINRSYACAPTYACLGIGLPSWPLHPWGFCTLNGMCCDFKELKTGHLFHSAMQTTTEAGQCSRCDPKSLLGRLMGPPMSCIDAFDSNSRAQFFMLLSFAAMKHMATEWASCEITPRIMAFIFGPTQNKTVTGKAVLVRTTII